MRTRDKAALSLDPVEAVIVNLGKTRLTQTSQEVRLAC